MLSLFALIGGLAAGLLQPFMGALYDRAGQQVFFSLVVLFSVFNLFALARAPDPTDLDPSITPPALKVSDSLCFGYQNHTVWARPPSLTHSLPPSLARSVALCRGHTCRTTAVCRTPRASTAST